MGDTEISWTHRPGTRGRTWNPVRGCSRTIAKGATQSGCGDGTGGGCYAERTAARFCGPGKPYEGLVRKTATGPRWTGVVRLVEDHLLDPFNWRDPSTVFVNSMSDLFHENLPDDAIDQVFAVMALSRQHTYQILTKRARRMREYITTPGRHESWSRHIRRIAPRSPIGGVTEDWFRQSARNIWLGVSTENQPALDERWPDLRDTPAPLRFLSVEPMIGPIIATDALSSGLLSWVIAGAESGPKSRPMLQTWIESLADQCQSAGVSFFAKQMVVDGRLSKRVADFPRHLQIQQFPEAPHG